MIGSLIFGALITLLSKTIPSRLPTYSLVILPNFLAPLLLNSNDITGEFLSNVGKAFNNKSPEILFLFFKANNKGSPDASNNLSDSIITIPGFVFPNPKKKGEEDFLFEKKFPVASPI